MASTLLDPRWLVLIALASCAAPGRPAGDLVTSSGALVARLVNPTHDLARHGDTCKPWHQVFAPDGRQITKDLGGQYEHHRGLFLGWNRVRCDGRTFDFWHCGKGETQRVVQVAGQPGPGAAQVVAVDWCAPDGAVVLHERRTLTVQSLGDGVQCLRLVTEVRAAAGEVQLDGDAHHAGCQFRAVKEFGDAAGPKVTYVRPDSAQGGNDDLWTGCRWIAAVLPFADGPVTVLRIEGASNPPATWSTRPYGRFGAMSRATLKAGTAVQLDFVYVVAAGARDAAWCERIVCDQD
ncbi:MAG: DUF6807 family protein [Planctomycetota bacterium]